MRKIIIYFIIIFCIFGNVVNQQCNNSAASVLPNQYQSYLSAQYVNQTQEQDIISVYNMIGNVGNYQSSISTSFTFYINKLSFCDKNPSTLETFNSQKDIWLCFDSYYLLQCNAQWSIVITCGTFVEFHKPFNPNILIRIDLAEAAWLQDTNNISITNAVIKTLCAGLYHIWFVYYSRAGKFIRAVKTIYISYPNCSC